MVSRACHRCEAPIDAGDMCQGCRAFLLGDTAVDPSGRPACGGEHGRWPFREWGPLVDLRSPDDLSWIP